MSHDHSANLQEQVKQSISDGSKIKISGNNSKQFLSGLHQANTANISSITTAKYQGIIDYQPTELVMQVRSGTPISEILSLIDKNNQILSFEPPTFDNQATIGGIIATGIAGSSRPWSGAVKDSLLGATILNSKAQINRFGGQVFKNVAGFDAFRPQAGAWGSLGIILNISLRLNPKPKSKQYFKVNCDATTALNHMIYWQKLPLDLTGACWQDNHLYLRLEGLNSAVTFALKTIKENIKGLKLEKDNSDYWQNLANTTIPTTNQEELCCWHVAPATALQTNNLICIDWAGAKRWYTQAENSKQLYQTGFWEIYPTNRLKPTSYLQRQPLKPELSALQKLVQQAFDSEQSFVHYLT